METQNPFGEGPRPASSGTPGTLGAVLYGGKGKRLVPESEWAALVAGVASREESSLHALYDRAHRVVFTLAVRITGNRESAEEVTLDVFHDVWRRAAFYDAANGTVLGWIMNQARSRAIDRLRFETRQKRCDPRVGEETEPGEADDPRVLVELAQEGAALRAALGALTPDERAAIELAFFAGLTHVEVAQRLSQPLGTIKTRIRSGLDKVRRAMSVRENQT